MQTFCVSRKRKLSDMWSHHDKTAYMLSPILRLQDASHAGPSSSRPNGCPRGKPGRHRRTPHLGRKFRKFPQIFRMDPSNPHLDGVSNCWKLPSVCTTSHWQSRRSACGVTPHEVLGAPEPIRGQPAILWIVGLRVDIRFCMGSFNGPVKVLM